ncbi:hypothetical protein M8C21_031825 [Ambrosia artemisiifolia]|uniref:SHSP domain-containing protein n=1 Tax=Ambrosia artemisiifolia TaxID=4212 RepID=A0AAD5BM93_AMBAR|nr:hypothetical protein M8C21_031825 [Ambrosia artemisiifolia]
MVCTKLLLIRSNLLSYNMLRRSRPASRFFCYKSVAHYDGPPPNSSNDVRIKKSPDGLDLFLYMSEVREDDVKVSVESNTVFVKAEGVDKSNDDTRAMKKFDCEIRLPDNKYRISDIKAQMKMDLGELKLSVPKLKEEKGVFNVKLNVIE